MKQKNVTIWILSLLSLILLIALFFNLFSRDMVSDKDINETERAETIAREWVERNSPTYLFDGSQLELVSSDLIGDGTYVVVFSFISSSAGYGDRSDQMSAQVMTNHEIELVVANNTLISAITDGVFSEMSESMIDENELNTNVVNPDSLSLDVYFLKVENGQEVLVAVEREVPYTLGTARASIEELIKGPSVDEISDGLFSMVDQDTVLQDIYIENGTAYLDFNEKLDENISGSASVMAIIGQIESTLTQFDSVNGVEISINGDSTNVLQP